MLRRHKSRLPSSKRFGIIIQQNIRMCTAAFHYLSELATQKYEASRVKVQKYLNAGSEREIIFVRGATEAINLVAATYGKMKLKPSDEVLITGLEHHSNIVPWQMICEEKGAIFVLCR